jgi:hypothetical protein
VKKFYRKKTMAQGHTYCEMVPRRKMEDNSSPLCFQKDG